MKVSSENKKILIFSDVHQDINKLSKIISHESADINVCLGDWFDSFFFDSDIESSYRKLDKYTTLSDSGSAYAGTMRSIQLISKNGIDSKYINEDENDLISELFANEDMVRVSIVSLSFLAFIGKIMYDENSK